MSSEMIHILVKTLSGECLSMAVDRSLSLEEIRDALSIHAPSEFPADRTHVTFAEENAVKVVEGSVLLAIVDRDTMCRLAFVEQMGHVRHWVFRTDSGAMVNVYRILAQSSRSSVIGAFPHVSPYRGGWQRIFYAVSEVPLTTEDLARCVFSHTLPSRQTKLSVEDLFVIDEVVVRQDQDLGPAVERPVQQTVAGLPCGAFMERVKAYIDSL